MYEVVYESALAIHSVREVRFEVRVENGVVARETVEYLAPWLKDVGFWRCLSVQEIHRT